MHKLLHIFTLLTISSLNSFADDPRYRSEFKSDNGVYILKVSEVKKNKIKDESTSYETYSEIKWGLYTGSDKMPLYEIPGPISERTACISDDGRFIIVINDWPSEQKDDSLKLILIYDNGNLIKSYSLSDIYNCGYNISSSVSHFEWCWGDIKVNFLSNTINFNTYELIDYTIDIPTGKIVEKQMDSRLNSNSIFAYGKVFGVKGGGFQMEVCHRVYGNIDSTGIILFKSDFDFHGGWYYTVLINNGKEEHVKNGSSDVHDITLNTCAFELEKLRIKPMGFNKINCR